MNFKLKFSILAGFVWIFVCSFALQAQKASVKGVVKDATTGDAIIGANILEKGTNNGTITNFDGEFTLSVSSNATLIVKYVGYKEVETPVAGKTNLIIQLNEDAVMLGEVV
ncbi:MAG: carboxypeptidase-like regulatory domain-containing protein, partial [Paludibacter sp.]|nr:carboxypeptidase-like regulatory domain-containing protein [Paludibacter sp.]